MSAPTRPSYSVVIPTTGRTSLGELLLGLAAQTGPAPEQVVVVDDRREADELLALPPSVRALDILLVPGFGRGPAAARNLGWRLSRTDWIAFLDDDVQLPHDWAEALARDLEDIGTDVGGCQGRIDVPLPAGRRPTDWERSTAGLGTARWATADMVYRRAALEEVEGFDERFRRAYREDADLALRVRAAGWRLALGRHGVVHPVRREGALVSLRAQRGNADDALMRVRHGRHWRILADAPYGRFRRHVLTTSALTLAAVAAAAGPTRPAGHPLRRTRDAALAGWLTLTVEFALHRILPGPRSVGEVSRMLLTSLLIPPAAVWHRARGAVRHRAASAWPPAPRAVLFDRDGTLVHDLPENRDPGRVAPVDGAREAVADLRSMDLRIGVVSNQDGVARRVLAEEDVARVNDAVDRLVGPFDTWRVCPHAEEEGCRCRKPRPGLVRLAARDLGVDPEECVVVGDIGDDVLAARAAGARGILVPTPVTLPDEVTRASWSVADLAGAVDLIRMWRRG